MTDDKAVLQKDTAVLVEDSLMAFGAGMLARSRTDVKNAFHFASLVASKRFDAEKEGEAWYDLFLKAMQDCGWVTARRNYTREHASATTVSVGSVAIRIIGAAGNAALGGAFGAAFGTLAQSALDQLGAIKDLKNAFVRNRKDKGNGMVGLAACLETASGEVVLVMGCVAATAPQADTDVLGIEWMISSSDYYTGTAVLSFNKPVYDKVRGHVEQKLGDRSVSNVLEYEL